MTDVEVIGVPTSAGAHHAGQEAAPAALRAHGLLDRLRDGGLQVHDAGDVAGETFRRDPSPGDGYRNIEAVVRVASAVADAVERVVRSGRLPLVLGGDCTIELGVVAGVQRVRRDVRLAYLDGDADLGGPGAPSTGIADSSGVAHLLGVVDDALSRLGPRFPMLDSARLALIGYDPDDPQAAGPALADAHPGLLRIANHELATDPDAAVERVRAALVADGTALVVHFDVDTIDSADLTLANFPHYGVGVPLDTARRGLQGLLALPGVAALALTEVNPTYDPGGGELDRYVAAVAAAITGALVPA